MKSQLLGAFSSYTCNISSAAKKTFEEVMEGFIGVEYVPVAVSTQVVQGCNYKFFCNATSSTNPVITGAAIVSVYAPLEGAPHITHIQAI